MIDFPSHKCGLYLQHNEHRDNYESAETWCENHNEFYSWKNDESKQRAITTDQIWTLQWYPDTPIGFFAIAAPTFEELIQFSNEVTS